MRQLVDPAQVVQQQVQMEVIHLLHPVLEFKKPLQVAEAVAQVMLLMALLVVQVEEELVDLQQQAVLLPHQGKVTQVVMVVVHLLAQIILEVLEAVGLEQQEVPQQQQTIQPMEQVA